MLGSLCFKICCLASKGTGPPKQTVQRDFQPPVFFLIWFGLPLTNGLQCFRVWFHFRWDIRIFPNLRTVSYWAESISAQFDTVRCQSLKFVIKSPRSMILRGVTRYCAESLDTARSQQPFLKTFAQGDNVIKINIESYSTNKGLHFLFVFCKSYD